MRLSTSTGSVINRDSERFERWFHPSTANVSTSAHTLTTWHQASTANACSSPIRTVDWTGPFPLRSFPWPPKSRKCCQCLIRHIPNTNAHMYPDCGGHDAEQLIRSVGQPHVTRDLDLHMHAARLHHTSSDCLIVACSWRPSTRRTHGHARMQNCSLVGPPHIPRCNVQPLPTTDSMRPKTATLMRPQLHVAWNHPKSPHTRFARWRIRA